MRPEIHPRPLAAVAALLAVLGLGAAPARAHDSDDDFRVVEHGAAHRTIAFAGASADGHRAIVVDNWIGPVVVTGEDRSDVALDVAETWSAKDAAAMARARREVSLAVAAVAGDDGAPTVRVRAEGPFRCPDGSERCRRPELPYEVRYALTLRVPRGVDLDLRTVNGEEVRVAGVRPAHFEIRNVNGELHLADLAGSGTAATVNGPIEASWATAPTGDSQFVTVNGEVAITAPADLHADLTVSTLNGEAWTDFDTTVLANGAPAAEREGGRTRWTSSPRRMRIGGGGPRLELQTVNGSITLRRR